jgi:hypothetical protein
LLELLLLVLHVDRLLLTKLPVLLARLTFHGGGVSPGSGTLAPHQRNQQAFFVFETQSRIAFVDRRSSHPAARRAHRLLAAARACVRTGRPSTQCIAGSFLLGTCGICSGDLEFVEVFGGAAHCLQCALRDKIMPERRIGRVVLSQTRLRFPLGSWTVALSGVGLLSFARFGSAHLRLLLQ